MLTSSDFWMLIKYWFILNFHFPFIFISHIHSFHFIHSFISFHSIPRYMADLQIPEACKAFVHDYGAQIVEKNLYRNFLLHLVNLNDFNILSRTHLLQTMELLDQLRKSESEDSSICSLAWIPFSETACSFFDDFFEGFAVKALKKGDSCEECPCANWWRAG